MANIKELIQSIESPDSSFDEKLAVINEMQDTLVAMKEHEQEAIDDNVELIIEALRTIEAKVEAKLRIIPEKGEQGIQGQKGEQGDRGLDGYQGKDGRDGKDGKDGTDGVDGVGVTDAKIDFDGSLVITLSDGREINVGEVVPVDVAEKIRTVHNIQSGSGGDSQTVLDAIAALQATIATYGTMATQNANNVAITGGTINNTTVGATTPSTGVFTTVTTPIVGAATGSSTTGLDLNVNSKAQARIVEIGDGTRPLVINGGSAGGAQIPGISAPAILGISAGGGNPVNFYTNGRVTTQQMAVSHTASAVNYVQVTGGATTKGVIQSAQGSDSNISYVTQSKGTGAIDLAAGSSGVNISNGGTVTAITRTAGGSAYATAPTVAISAPTTAGGVQATATVAVSAGAITTFTITNAGSGYVEQPTVTFSGGGGSGAAAYATVGSGTIIRSLGSTGNQSLDFYTPASITSSIPALRIRDLSGSDSYPMIQGGSSVTSILAQGNTNATLVVGANGGGGVRFTTSGTGLLEQLRVSHTASAVNYVQVTGAATGNRPVISAQGSDTNIPIDIQTKGTGHINFTPNRTNYISVFGAGTGASPQFLVSGGDTNIDLTLTPKGTGNVRFGTYTGTILTPTGYVEIKDSGGTVRRLLVG